MFEIGLWNLWISMEKTPYKIVMNLDSRDGKKEKPMRRKGGSAIFGRDLSTVYHGICAMQEKRTKIGEKFAVRQGLQAKKEQPPGWVALS